MAAHYDRIKGLQYINFMKRLHQVLQPQTYFEIGTASGESLRPVKCKSIAVDPQFNVTGDIIGTKPACHLFQMPSDRFFREVSPTKIFDAPIDFAFLDGMHVYEFLLRDFINTEKHCRPNSIVTMHDCLPGEFYITHRDIQNPIRQKAEKKHFWTGDVWKIIPILKTYRPDINMLVVDAVPTGLVVLSNLDPNNTVLSDNYRDILREQNAKTDADAFDAFWSDLVVTSTDKLNAAEDIFAHFWL